MNVEDDRVDVDALMRRMIAVGSRPDVTRYDVRRHLPEFSSGGFDAMHLSRAVLGHAQASTPSDLEFAALVRTMTLCEAAFELPGGSASPVIFAFRSLLRRNRPLADELAGWIVDHRGSNWYTPWGRWVGNDARSVEEFHSSMVQYRLQIKAEQEEVRRQAAKRRNDRARRQKDHRKRAATARPVRQHRIADALSASDGECVRLVLDSDETVDFWTDDVAYKCLRALPELPPGELDLLLRKLHSAPPGAWRDLRRVARVRRREG